MKERRQRRWIMVITKSGKDRGRGYELYDGEETEEMDYGYNKRWKG